MASRPLADLVKEAGEIAKSVPESMQEAAFNRALDQLLGNASTRSPSGSSRTQKPTRKLQRDTAADNPASRLINEIDRTAHPQIAEAPNVVQRAMIVLRIAQAECDIDGLTAPQIAQVLTDKYRQPTTSQAVAQALGSAGRHVDIKKDGRSSVYRLMGPGERYLDSEPWRDPGSSDSKIPPRRSKAKKSATKKKNTPARPADATTKKPAAKPSKASGTPTAGQVVQQLLDGGYLDSPRSIADMIEHVQASQGRRYKANELSPSLLRMLRNSTLTREKNNDGKYEYARA